MNIQQLRQSLKVKWVSHYYKNRSWLVKMRIWATYDGQRRPSSSFILATLSALEPQLEQIFPFILDLNNNPDKIVSALGLNFNPEEHLHLVKDNFVAENQDSSQSSLDTLVSEKPPKRHVRARGSHPTAAKPQQDASPCCQPRSSDRQLLATNAATTKIQIEDKPIPLDTPVTEPHSESPAKPFPHKPVRPVAIATEVQNKSKPTRTIALTKMESNSVLPIAVFTEIESKNKPLVSVAVDTKIENKSKPVLPIAIATKAESNSVLPIAVFTEIDNQSNSVIPIAVDTKIESDAVLPIAVACESESKDKLVNNIPNNEANLSPTNKVRKLANWIDDFCQGTGWDREEAIFIPF